MRLEINLSQAGVTLWRWTREPIPGLRAELLTNRRAKAPTADICLVGASSERKKLFFSQVLKTDRAGPN